MEKSPGILVTLCALCLCVALPAQEFDSQEYLREIIRRHVRANGYLDIQQKYSSFKAEGTMEQGEAKAEFTIFKRDGRLRLEILQGETENVLLYDGKVGWQWISKPSPKVITKLNKAQTAWLAQEAKIESILSDYDDRGYKAELGGIVTLPDYVDDLYQIRLRSSYLDEEYDVYLSSRNYLEVRRDFRPAADQPVLQTEFSDYREVDGLAVPFLIENYVDGALVSRTQLEHVQINAGVVGFYFKAPSNLTVHKQP